MRIQSSKKLRSNYVVKKLMMIIKTTCGAKNAKLMSAMKAAIKRRKRKIRFRIKSP